jgi:hypothetical protein
MTESFHHGRAEFECASHWRLKGPDIVPCLGMRGDVDLRWCYEGVRETVVRCQWYPVEPVSLREQGLAVFTAEFAAGLAASCVTVLGEAVDWKFWRFPRPWDGGDIAGGELSRFSERRLLSCKCWVTGKVVPE